MLFCYFIHRTGPENTFTPISRREVQKYFNRVGGRRVSTTIKRFWTSGLLDRIVRKPRGTAIDYRVNRDFLKSPQGRLWVELARQLFDESHPWKRMLMRPAFGHGYLNRSGALVAGAILGSPRGVTTAELQTYFRGLMGEQTVRNCVQLLEREALAFRNHEGRIVIPDDFHVRLSEYERSTGATKRSERIRKTVAQEREVFLEGYENWLRKQKEIFELKQVHSGGQLDVYFIELS